MFVIPPGADLEKLRGGPDVTFEGLMPKPGRYRAWTQFRRRDQLPHLRVHVQRRPGGGVDRTMSALLLSSASPRFVAAVCWSRAASPHETVTTTVLFDREIVGILNRHCVMCHVEKGPSFPLETYEQAWLQRRKISAAVLARRMPPWPAMSGYGRFANENVVTLRESQFLVSWMEGLGPRNAGKVFTNTSRPDAPAQQAVRAHMDFGAWHLGPPDLVRELEPNTVGPSAGIKRCSADA